MKRFSSRFPGSLTRNELRWLNSITVWDAENKNISNHKPVSDSYRLVLEVMDL